MSSNRGEPDPSPAAQSGGLGRKLLIFASVILIGGALYFEAVRNREPEPDPEAFAAPQRFAMAESETDAADVELLDAMIRSEELIAQLEVAVGELAFSVANLEFPDQRTRDLFWPLGIEIVDLAPEPARGVALASFEPIREGGWPLANPQPGVSAPEVRLWRPLLDHVAFFDSAKFKVKKGHFLEGAEGDPQIFETTVLFTGLARMRAGAWSWLRVWQTVHWRLLDGADPEEMASWRIVLWRVDDVSRSEAPSLLFRDVLPDAIPTPAEYRRARDSIHDRLVGQRLLAKRSGDQFDKPHPHFNDIANDRHPGISVVDIDADGFDDLYVMARWGRNQFFRNQGDGTFAEIAAQLGLDIEGFSSSAVFGDFDNDGDADLFLGRTLERSAYFENVDGRFVDRSADQVTGLLPYLVSSVNAVDYDGDGLLDLYVSTYGAASAARAGYGAFLSKKQLTLLNLHLAESDSYLDAVGPPNVLLHNEGGGRLRVVDGAGPLQAYFNTYQTTWADYDGDGDPDAYLANDLAPDQLIRNDGGGRFADVTDEMGLSNFGFGMGATWGDYDRDGLQDVYVANMYSTAGTRITAQLPFLDDRYRQSADGNYLYRNEGEAFRKVSGKRQQDLHVEQTGWSWGPQFVDVDNDGFLDVAVLNGYYTAPPEVAIAGDS